MNVNYLNTKIGKFANICKLNFKYFHKIMNNFDSPQERLYSFIVNNYKKRKDFCEQLGIKNYDLSKYIGKGKSVFKSHDKIEKLKSMGLDIDWYHHGTKIDNDTGNQKIVQEKSNVSDIVEAELIELPDIRTLNINQMNKVYSHLKEYMNKMEAILEIVNKD